MPDEDRLFHGAGDEDLFGTHRPAPWAPPRAPVHLTAPRAPGRGLGLADPTPLLALASTAALAASAYVVQPGDTLSEIAARHGVETEQIAAASGVADLDLIYAGQELTVPGEAQPAGDGATTSPAPDGAVEELAPAAAVHRVQPGDTLSAIAGRYGTTVTAIAAANGIDDPDHVVVGRELDIPGESSAPAPAPAPTTAAHDVAPGETLSEIARRYGVDVTELAAANGITDPDHLVAGERLTIPGAWHCPVPGATFVDDFGYEKSDGRRHEGIDLFAPRGTQVLAPVGGRVEHVEGDRGGKQFWLHGNDGRVYIGTHLDAFGADGQVRPGSVVGEVGTSGNAAATSPHLHFEIHEDDGPVNPYAELVAACR